MARGRRRTKYQWFQPIGTVGPGANAEDDSSGRDFAFTLPNNGTSGHQIVDLLNDTASEDTLGQPMVVTAGNEYFVKRIVGKAFFELTQVVEDAGAARGILLGLGLFIARAGDADDAAGAENLPIGDPADQGNNYSVLRVENIREPWIWRRTWILTQTQRQNAISGFPGTFPTSTAGYGSVSDGPHIDAKTARRVRDGERLFAILSARNYPVNSTSDVASVVRGYLDYRVLGALRKAHNRSAF